MSFALAIKPSHPAPASRGFSLASKGLHELYAGAEADGVSMSALAMMLGSAGEKRVVLWVRHEGLSHEMGSPHPSGLAELGFDPNRLLLLQARDVPAALQGALEGARCSALGAVIVEIRGEARAYDLTASRRLSLAAKTSGVPVLMARAGAVPAPSAADTRWQVKALPSRPLPARAPGAPFFEMSLLRARNGQEGLLYHVEWNRDARRLEIRFTGSATANGPAENGRAESPALSGFVVPVSFDRPGAACGEPTRERRAG